MKNALFPLLEKVLTDVLNNALNGCNIADLIATGNCFKGNLQQIELMMHKAMVDNVNKNNFNLLLTTVFHLRIPSWPPEEGAITQSSGRPSTKPNLAWESLTFSNLQIYSFSQELFPNKLKSRNLFSCAYWQGSKICLKTKAVLQILALCSHAFTGANGWSVDGYQDSPRGRK